VVESITPAKSASNQNFPSGRLLPIGFRSDGPIHGVGREVNISWPSDRAVIDVNSIEELSVA
jgi:hypothetical protein